MLVPACPRGFFLHVQLFFQMAPSVNRVPLSPPPDAGAMASLDFSTSSHITLDLVPLMYPLFHVTHEARDPSVNPD